MPKTARNCSTGYHSTRTATRAHDTGSIYFKYLVEKSAKNTAYAFILSSGLLPEFAAFSVAYRGEVETLDGRVELALKSHNLK